MLSTLLRCWALLALTGLDFRTVVICKTRSFADKTGQSKYNFQLHLRVLNVGLMYKKSRALVWTPTLASFPKWLLNKSNTWLDSKSLTELISLSPIDKVFLERAEEVAGNTHWQQEIFVHCMKTTNPSFLPLAC